MTRRSRRRHRVKTIRETIGGNLLTCANTEFASGSPLLETRKRRTCLVIIGQSGWP
jgi:hypothetical protein